MSQDQDILRILIATDNHLVRFKAPPLLINAAFILHSLSFRHISVIVHAACSVQGVWENDDVRKDDSFVSFKEVFQIAEQQNADLVLLGGDLFHENKPSRQTVVKAMDILNKHCLNDRPIAFQILSDQTKNFTTG